MFCGERRWLADKKKLSGFQCFVLLLLPVDGWILCVQKFLCEFEASTRNASFIAQFKSGSSWNGDSVCGMRIVPG